MFPLRPSIRWSNVYSSTRALTTIANLLRKPEIYELQVTICIYQDVLRFEISIRYALMIVQEIQD